MKKYQFLLLVFSFIFFNLSVLNAQIPKFKFGKLNKIEAEMKYYNADSSASAVILFDKGFSYYEYDSNSGFTISFKRDVRIKFFKKDAFDLADFEIPLYVGSKGNEEMILSLKGRTYNIENGKIETVKVNKSNIFYDKKSKHWRIAKIAFPNIKKGSVIDFEYRISSDFLFNLRGWQFQYKIPVRYSEYTVIVPEYFDYNKNQKGYDNVFLEQRSENRDENFTINYRSTPQAGGKTEVGSYTINSLSKLLTFKASAIPAFVEEPNITTPENYMSAIEFELKSIAYPRQPIEYYTATWEDVNKKLLKNRNFGLQLKPTNKIKLQAEEVCRDAVTKNEKIAAIYNWIKKNIKWNEYFSIYIDDKLYDVIREKKGNVSDINMLLIMMLKSQGIKANPVLLSTRKHGMIFPTHPTLSTFNYVIAEVKIDDKTYYVDATDEYLPFGMLPFRCLNGIGRRIGAAGEGEVQIIPSAKYKESYMYSLKIIPGEGLSGTVNKIYKEYAAYEMRDDIKDNGGEEEFVSKFIDNSDDAEISEVTYTNINDIDKPLKETYKFLTSDNITFAGNMIYLTPLLNEKKDHNPYKLDERKYPVDYGYPYNKKMIFQYTIPDGYELSEKPESVSFSLPGRSAQFQYQVSVAGNMCQVISIFKINKAVFQYDSYKALKKFYDLVIKKQNEKIVFIKK